MALPAINSRYSRATAICPGCPRTSCMRASNGESLPFNASTDMAPATTAAANRSSAPNSPASASAVDTCVPLIKARPSLARSLRGSRPAAVKPSAAGNTLPRTRTCADAEQHRAQVRQRRQIAGCAHRSLRGNHRIDLVLQQREQGIDQGHGDAGMPACQRVDLQREDQTDDGVGQRVAHARGMREQQIALQQLELLGRYAGLGQQTEARVDAVGRVAGGDDLVHQREPATAMRPRSCAVRSQSDRMVVEFAAAWAA